MFFVTADLAKMLKKAGYHKLPIKINLWWYGNKIEKHICISSYKYIIKFIISLFCRGNYKKEDNNFYDIAENLYSGECL